MNKFKVFIAIGLFINLFFYYFSFAYYPDTTHAGLTEQIVEYYISSFKQEISVKLNSEIKDYL